jgi:2-dehydropantoate 2-reductase
VAANRLVFGGITFISWLGDLDGGGGRPGAVNYWLPPLSQIPLVGDKQACLEVAALLKKGGVNAAVQKKNFQATQAGVTALMTAFVVGYELAGWSLSAYRRSPWLKLAGRGAWEAALSQVFGVGIAMKTLFRILTTAAVFYVTTLILPYLTPFNLEKYLKVHYLKTREQTLVLLDVFVNDGENLGLAVNNIRLLQQGLRGLDEVSLST